MKANNPPRVALEECAPNVFIVHDIRVRPFLHGEGDYTGNRFVLTSWRRDGLFARIRDRGLEVASLDAQIAALPTLPPAPPLAATPRWHVIGHADERWSYYDAPSRTIIPCTVSDQQSRAVVAITPGWLVRRRRGRGGGEWYRTMVQGSDTIQLTHIDQDAALLCGLAQAATYVHAPLPLTPQSADVVVLRTPVLPQPYIQCANRWATSDRDGITWHVPVAHLHWMQHLLARLSIVIATVPKGDSNA